MSHTEAIPKVGGDGSSGYNLFSIAACLSKVVREHTNKQLGEEVELQIINAQQLRLFQERCLLEYRRG